MRVFVGFGCDLQGAQAQTVWEPARLAHEEEGAEERVRKKIPMVRVYRFTATAALCVTMVVDVYGREHVVDSAVINFDSSFTDEQVEASAADGFLEVTASSMKSSFDKNDLYLYLVESQAVKITESRLKAQSGAAGGGKLEVKKWKSLQTNVQTILVTPHLQLVPFPVLVDYLAQFSTVDLDGSNAIELGELEKVLQTAGGNEAGPQEIMSTVKSLFLPAGPLAHVAQVLGGLVRDQKESQYPVANAPDKKLQLSEFCSACEYLRTTSDDGVLTTSLLADSSFLEMQKEKVVGSLLGLAALCGLAGAPEGAITAMSSRLLPGPSREEQQVGYYDTRTHQRVGDHQEG
ncbi:unnamed protein product [Amoebophrya sp. A120]|nr:unnamed protein product [Amoebophrya sp. A120]|eukprot:GSA120T00020962001.1